MHYRSWYVAGAFVATTFAQTISLSLENDRLAPDNCRPQLHFCSDTNWRNCNTPVTAPYQCVRTDRLNEATSIAIELGLCCRFYTDYGCNTPVAGWGGTEAWFPGIAQVDDTFKEQVGSYMCQNGTTSSDCPGVGLANRTLSASIAEPTTSLSY